MQHRLLAGPLTLLLLAAAGRAADPPAVPKGEVTKYTFDQSKIFPGTVRDYWIYVPEAVRPGQAGLPLRQPGRHPVQRAGGLRRADPQEGDAGRHRRLRHARPGQGAVRARRSIASIAATSTTAWATITSGSCSRSCCPRSRRRRRGRPADPALARRQRPLHRRRQQRRDLRVHRRLGAARRLPPRLQRDRHLRRPARRQRLSDADPQVRAEADPHLPPGRQRRSEHLRRRLVDGQPGDGARPDLRRLRGQPRLGHRRPQRRARHRDFPRRHALALEGLARARQGRGRLAAAPRRSSSPARTGRWSPRATGSPRARPPTPRARSSSTTSPTARPTRSASTARSASSSPTRSRPTARRSGPTAGSTPSPPAPSQILAYDADGKPTVIAEGIRGNDLVVRHDGGIYVTNPGCGRHRAEQGLVHQPQGREAGRRHRA